ncbi:uncharacterized protein LOC105026651 [Esox lucius]|uniref:uncharacterized protein LOC105026651 n=1 Tax=Esox lucius TaxID=8010 RepID=UPI0005767CA3|nr:uncharacterized protein LOC105026651 [Esox lucius]
MPGTECSGTYIGLALTSLALLVSVCVNIILFILRHRDIKHRADTEELLYPLHYPTESPIRFEEEEEEENHQQQENPIYGNIASVSEGNCTSLCYESMTLHHSRANRKPPQTVSHLQHPDLNYASLDLDVGQKRKKKRRYHQNQTQGPAQAARGFLEVDAEVEASLPSRSSSPLASRNSIYLNSQQMALETEERERVRERGWDRDREWDTGREERGRNRDREWDTANGPSAQFRRHNEGVITA